MPREMTLQRPRSTKWSFWNRQSNKISRKLKLTGRSYTFKLVTPEPEIYRIAERILQCHRSNFYTFVGTELVTLIWISRKLKVLFSYLRWDFRRALGLKTSKDVFCVPCFIQNFMRRRLHDGEAKQEIPLGSAVSTKLGLKIPNNIFVTSFSKHFASWPVQKIRSSPRPLSPNWISTKVRWSTT